MSEKQIVGVVAKNSIAYIEAIFESYANDETVVLLRDANDKRIETTGVTKVIEPGNQAGWYKKHYKFRSDNTLAQIAFTSGTEGEPKGVLLTHEALSDVTQRLNDIMEVDSSIREYVSIPANFSFGLGRFRAVSSVGGEAFLPQHGFDLFEIRIMLATDEINAVSAVPSLWRVLLKNKQIFGSEAQKLKWIEIGSQYMSRSEKEELKALFPNAKIAQHYGLTEASRSSFLRIDQIEGDHLESVGKAYGKTEFKISDTGRICIRGPHVATTLLKNGEYVSNVDEEGWFHTSDLGRLDANFLYYLGRADDLINCGGTKLSPDALERELRQTLGIKEGIAVSAVDDELTGHAVLVGYLKETSIDEDLLTKAAIEVVASFGLNNRRAIKVFAIDAFPVTSTNKVKRKELSKLYLEHQKSLESSYFLSQSSSESLQSMTEEEGKIATIWADVLKLDKIDVNSSFYDLGGDSLSAIGALIAMESKGVPSNVSKGMLQGMTIREIAARLETSSSVTEAHQIRSPVIRNSMTINIVRGLMVLIVIFAHWHQGFTERIPGFNAEGFTAFIAPLLAMGTPGFVLIYGVGAGYALFPMMEQDPQRLKRILLKTFKFLVVGITAMAVVFFGEKLATQETISFTDFTNSFFSVLTFYALISATLYYWFFLLKKSRYPLPTSLLIACLAYVIHINFIASFGLYKTTGIIEFIKLLFTGKYAYFLMLSGTMLGVAVGLILNQMTKQNKPFSALFIAGVALIVISIELWMNINIMDQWDKWPFKTIYVWRWLLYIGIIILLLGLIEKFLRYYSVLPKWQRFCIQALSIIGMLAFPLFVIHEMVIPMKTILVSYGISEMLALLFPMVIFFAISYLMFRKLHSVSFQ